jgi:hypothetical protein
VLILAFALWPLNIGFWGYFPPLILLLLAPTRLAFGAKALSFSKKLTNHIGAIKYFICHYNQEISGEPSSITF